MTDLYFPVEKIPVQDICSEELEHPSGISHAIVVTKSDGSKRVVQYCSELYYLIPNSEIIPVFETEISRFFSVEKRVKIQNWSRFFIDFVIMNKSLEIMKGDNILPKIRVVNSYDGSIRYHFQAGFFRLVCSNGLMVPEGETREFKSMHTPKLGKETSFEAVLEMVSEFMASASDIVETYRELQEQPVNDWMMRIEELVEETTFPSSLQEEVTARMMVELKALPDNKPNDWLIYNAFNYQLNHNDDLKTKQNKKDAMDQEVLSYLLKY